MVDNQYPKVIFRGWDAAMYSGIGSVVKVNGHLSEPFPICQSDPQGYPLSSFLYAPTWAFTEEAGAALGHPVRTGMKKDGVTMMMSGTDIWKGDGSKT